MYISKFRKYLNYLFLLPVLRGKCQIIIKFMKSFLIILCIASFTKASFLVTKHCACTEILSQTDCTAAKGCAWGTSCDNKTCSTITT